MFANARWTPRNLKILLTKLHVYGNVFLHINDKKMAGLHGPTNSPQWLSFMLEGGPWHNNARLLYCDVSVMGSNHGNNLSALKGKNVYILRCHNFWVVCYISLLFFPPFSSFFYSFIYWIKREEHKLRDLELRGFPKQ